MWIMKPIQMQNHVSDVMEDEWIVKFSAKDSVMCPASKDMLQVLAPNKASNSILIE